MKDIVMTKDFLYLGSQSQGRRDLLTAAGIDFKLLEHTSDESCDFSQLNFNEGVKAITRAKMESLLLPIPADEEKNYCFVVTADTLTCTSDTGEILGKPKDKVDALKMLERKGPVDVATGCCVRRYLRVDDSWQVEVEYLWANITQIEFFVPEGHREHYLDVVPQALYSSGAGIVEGKGLLYLKSIQGCFASVTGLPLYELREALGKCGFQFF